MIIEVTKEHIHKGVRNACQACPVALAVQEHTAPDIAVVVTKCFIRLWRGTTLLRVVTPPPDAAQFITTFDNGLKVEPFSFELEIDEEFLK